MTLAFLIFCASALFAQYRHHVYRGLKLEERIVELEKQRAETFDPKAFADLQSKVEALRVALGMRR